MNCPKCRRRADFTQIIPGNFINTVRPDEFKLGSAERLELPGKDKKIVDHWECYCNRCQLRFYIFPSIKEN